MTVSRQTQTLLDTVNQRIGALESFAVRHRLCGADLPPPPPVRKFHSTRGLFNAIDSTLMRIEHLADALPRNVSYGRSHIQATVVDYDPGDKFWRVLGDKVGRLVQSAREVGKLSSEFGAAAGIIAEQGELLAAAFKAEGDVISKASKMAKPASPKALQQHCEQLIDHSADVSDLKYDVDVRSKLRDHAMALGDCAGALGWITSPAALKHAREYRAIVETLTSNILANYIELGCNPLHSHFAEALNATVEALATYVEKEHPAGLRWNYAHGATPQGYRRAQRKVTSTSHPIGDFYRSCLHGGVTEHVEVARELGGELATAAECVQAAYEEMASAIEAASNRDPPHGDPSAVLKMLLVSVQNELTVLSNVLQPLINDERHRFHAHANALAEFAHSMQWSSATMQKMSPVGYIIDVENVTLLYLKQVDQRFLASQTTYVAQLHRRWTQSVRTMLTDLKEYVKLHHPNQLMFDTRRSRKSVDDLLRSTSLSHQLAALRLKSTAIKWVCAQRTKMTKHGRKTVRVWTKAT